MMKSSVKIFRRFGQAVSLAALLFLALSPITAGDSHAIGLNGQPCGLDSSCQSGHCISYVCQPSGLDPNNPTGPGGVNAPEMPDMLIVPFVLIALGAAFYIRRRSLASR